MCARARALLITVLVGRSRYIKTLKLQVPWKRLKKDSVVVTADEVFVVLVCPLSLSPSVRPSVPRLPSRRATHLIQRVLGATGGEGCDGRRSRLRVEPLPVEQARQARHRCSGVFRLPCPALLFYM